MHRKAHPIFHGAAVVVNDGLVQFPWSWVAGRSSCNGVPGAVVGGEPEPGADVVVTELAAAVVEAVVVPFVAPDGALLFGAVLPPLSVGTLEGAVVVGAAPPVAAWGGRAYDLVVAAWLDPPES